MKGLIIKDIMCLKKQLTLLIYVMAGVIVLSVMYVLSARYGNIAMMGQEMLAGNGMTAIDVKNLGTVALVAFMLLPLAVVGDMANVFVADGKAGFYKISGILPVSLKKRLLARYVSIYALFGLGAVIDILLALVLSVLTDLIRFQDFLGIILSSASVMSIYSGLVIFFCILLGYGKEQYATILSIFLMVAVVILMNLKTIKMIFLMDDFSFNASGISFWGMLDFIKEKAWILVLTALAVSLASYGASYLIAERKRGII